MSQQEMGSKSSKRVAQFEATPTQDRSSDALETVTRFLESSLSGYMSGAVLSGTLGEVVSYETDI